MLVMDDNIRRFNPLAGVVLREYDDDLSGETYCVYVSLYFSHFYSFVTQCCSIYLFYFSWLFVIVGP